MNFNVFAITQFALDCYMGNLACFLCFLVRRIDFPRSLCRKVAKLFVINNLIFYNGKTDKVIGTLQKMSNIFIYFARYEIFGVY